MSTAEKGLFSLLVFGAVAFAIAAYRNYKTEKKFLDVKRYIMGIFKSMNMFGYALFGSSPLRKPRETPADHTFMRVSKGTHEEALQFANKKMVELGAVYNAGDEKRTVKKSGELGYCRRLFDCENFAASLKHYYDVYVATKCTAVGKGIPTEVIGYVTHNGHPHSIVEFIVEGVVVWHNCYPKNGSFEELKLTQREQDTIKSIGRG